MFLIVGLGNPGEKYKTTRHNLGFIVLDQLAATFRIKFTRKKQYWIAKKTFKNDKIILIKPTTYMNMSGKAVYSAVYEFKTVLSQLLIICDDFNLPLGKIRIRGKGSEGGHNGLASVIESLGTINFPRLRIGIGSNFRDGEVVDYVLSPFKSSELEIVNKSVELSKEVIISFITRGLMATMNMYN